MLLTGAATALSFGSTAPLSVAIGDSRTANRNDGQTCWPYLTLDGLNNLAVVGTVWSQIVAQAPAGAGRVIAQGGVNDILSGADGAALFATEKTWAEALAATGVAVFLMNIPGFKGYDNNSGKLAQRIAFNNAFASAAQSPATNLFYIDIATPLQNPADTDAMQGAYTTDFLHYTTSANVVIAGLVNAAYVVARQVV